MRGRDFGSYRQEEFLTNPVVLISENYWQKRFGGDQAVVGRTVYLNSVGVVIAGITPHDFCGTSIGAPAFWAPVEIEPLLHADRQFLRDREAQRYRLFGRLARLARHHGAGASGAETPRWTDCGRCTIRARMRRNPARRWFGADRRFRFR